MADNRSAPKRAMDEKLAEVWGTSAKVTMSGRSEAAATRYSDTISAERVSKLKPQQEEAARRVFGADWETL